MEYILYISIPVLGLIIIYILVRFLSQQKLGKDIAGIDQLLQQGKFTQVVKRSQELLKKKPGDFWLLCFQAEAYYWLKEYDASEQKYKLAESRLIQTNSDQERLYSRMGELYFNMENYQESLVYFMMVLKIDSTSPKALLKTAQAFYKTINYPKALEYLEKYLKIEKNNFSAYLLYAKIKSECKEYKTAEKFLKRVLMNEDVLEDGTVNESKMLLGDVYLQTKCYEKAIKSFQEFLFNKDNVLNQDILIKIIEAQVKDQKVGDAEYTFHSYQDRLDTNHLKAIQYFLAQGKFWTLDQFEALEMFQEIYTKDSSYKDVSKIIYNNEIILRNPKFKNYFTSDMEKIRRFIDSSFHFSSEVDFIFKGKELVCFDSPHQLVYVFRIHVSAPSMIEFEALLNLLEEENYGTRFKKVYYYHINNFEIPDRNIMVQKYFEEVTGLDFVQSFQDDQGDDSYIQKLKLL